MTTYAEMRKMLAQDKLAKLIESLHAATAHLDTDLNNQVINIAGRFSRINNQLNTGQVSHEEANMERSRVSAALLDVLNRLEGAYPDAFAQATTPPIRAAQHHSTSPAQQSRPTWPYILVGVMGSIIVLAIIGMMMEEKGTTEASNTGHYADSISAPVQRVEKKGAEPIREPAVDPQPDNSTSDAESFTRDDLVGAWQFTLSDGTTHVVTAIHFNANGSYQSSATMDGAIIGQDYGTWRLSGNTFYQNSASSGASNYQITWESEHQFTATDPSEGTFVTFTRM